MGKIRRIKRIGGKQKVEKIRRLNKISGIEELENNKDRDIGGNEK